MPLQTITMKPGLNSVRTATLNQGGYSSASNVRFFEGLPQKDGGFINFTNVPDIPRSMRAWTALSGISYLASVGSQRVILFSSQVTYDITPLTISDSVPLALTTSVGSATVTVTDSTNTPTTGQSVEFVCPVAAGGLLFHGIYTVASTAGGSWTFVAPQQATAVTTQSGSARTFTTAINSTVVIVTIANHNLFSGDVTTIPLSTAVGGVTLFGNYVTTVLNPTQYTINASTPATSVQTVSENSGRLALIFYNPLSGGMQNPIPVVTTTSDNWGEFLLSCGQAGPVNVWKPALGTSSPAVNVTTAPQINNVIFVSIQAQQLICLGTINLSGGAFDPMLVRWSDTGDYTSFTPAVGNAAGSFRLPTGSKLTAGLPMVGQNLIWSDLALWSMQYVGQPLVWGFQPLGVNCGAVGAHCVGILSNTVYWMNKNQFFVLGPAGPQMLECPVWDQVFPHIDQANLQNVVCETDTFYGEVGWSVPQSNGTVAFVRVRPDPERGPLWTASTYHHHTAWIDQNVFGAPLGGHETGLIDQHDVGVDAAGAALPTSLTTGMILIAQGEQTSFVRDFYPDVNWLGTTTSSLALTLSFYDYPESTPRVHGPYTITPTTKVVHPRGRGRQVQINWQGNDIGSNWRMGDNRIRVQPDGRR